MLPIGIHNTTSAVPTGNWERAVLTQTLKHVRKVLCNASGFSPEGIDCSLPNRSQQIQPAQDLHPITNGLRMVIAPTL